MKKPDSLINYYSLRAPEYEQIYYRNIPIKRKELADEAERLARLVEGRQVLDLVCGTGYWTKVMAETAAMVVATDISDKMIAEARKKDYSRPVHFVRADLYRLPFGTAVFDIITLGFWFSHEPRQNYELFFRMLKEQAGKDGKIWMIDNNPPAEGPRYKSVGTDEHGNNYRQRFLNSGEEFAILKNYFDRAQLQELLSPHFEIESLIHNECYWSVVVSCPKTAPES